MNTARKKNKPMAAHVREAGGLNAHEKTFLFNLASHDTFEDFANRDLLRERTGLSDRKFRETIRGLQDKGLIAVIARPGGRSTIYRLNVTKLKAWPRTAKDEALAKKNARYLRRESRAQVGGTPVSAVDTHARQGRRARVPKANKRARVRRGHR